MYKLKKDHGKVLDPDNDIETVISDKVKASKTLQCNAKSCDNITLLRHRIMEGGDYFIYMEFNYSTDNLYHLDSLVFTGQTQNAEYATMQGLVKIILFVASLVNCTWFWCNLRRMPSSNYSFEQKYLKWLTVIMCFFFDPFSILQHFYPSAFG